MTELGRGAGRSRIVAAGMIGNVLEWYDFAVYGYFAAAIGTQFFPHQSATAQILASFGVFAVGYLMRPVGGAIVGHIGDRRGRRAALTFSVTAMAVSTFLIGVLPGYEALGLLAPLVLTLLRMTQGLSVGGEYTTSMVFLVEHADPRRRGLMGAVACCGALAGLLLGSATSTVLASFMSAEALDAWGWRIPFLFGLVIGAAGFLIRRHVGESPPVEGNGGSPVLDTARRHPRLVLRLAGLSVFNAVGFYLSFVYIVSWLQLADGIPPAQALEINTINMVLLIPVILAVGWLSDRFGRKLFLFLGSAAGFLGAFPFLWLMHHTQFELMLAGQFGFVIAVGTFLAVLPASMVESVPKTNRCTVIALGYNICLGIVGGLSPLVASWLVERTGDDLSPAFLVMAAAAVSFMASFMTRETYRLSLDGNAVEIAHAEPRRAAMSP